MHSTKNCFKLGLNLCPKNWTKQNKMSWIHFCKNRLKCTGHQFTNVLQVHHKKSLADTEATAFKMEAPFCFECRRRLSQSWRVRASDWQHGTFMGIPHKVPFWLMAQPPAPPSLHSSVLIYSSSLCDLALALPTTSPVETPCGHIHYYLESRWAKASDRNIHTLIHTHYTVSSHSHWACARGQVSLPLPPLWKDLSPRGLSCLVGQRGKRLCKPAKWGVGLGMHEANPHTNTHTHVQTGMHTYTASLREPRRLLSLPMCSLWSLSVCQDLHKEINPSGEGINT